MPGTPKPFQAIMDFHPSRMLVACVDSTAGSTAYRIAPADDSIWITPYGSAASVGVSTVHEGLSKALEIEGVKPGIIRVGRYET